MTNSTNQFSTDNYMEMADSVSERAAVAFVFDDEDGGATAYEAQLIKDIITIGVEEAAKLAKEMMESQGKDEIEMAFGQTFQLRISKSEGNYAISLVPLSELKKAIKDDSSL